MGEDPRVRGPDGARMTLPGWACPACHAALTAKGDGLRCVAGHSYEVRHGLPVLVVPGEWDLLAKADRHAEGWARTAWAPPQDRIALLPYAGGRTWASKARSYERLVEILGPAEGRLVADLGAGTGWLSRRLVAAGFRCFATDLTADARVGLGALRGDPAVPAALASLTHWPFPDASIDVAICNASLHFLPDPSPALDEATRALRAPGTFVILNSPVHRDAASAVRAARDFARRVPGSGEGSLMEGYRHFVESDLEAKLRARFPEVRRHDPDYGAWFRVSRKWKGILLGMELASFPIYVARKR